MAWELQSCCLRSDGLGVELMCSFTYVGWPRSCHRVLLHQDVAPGTLSPSSSPPPPPPPTSAPPTLRRCCQLCNCRQLDGDTVYDPGVSPRPSSSTILGNSPPPVTWELTAGPAPAAGPQARSAGVRAHGEEGERGEGRGKEGGREQGRRKQGADPNAPQAWSPARAET